MKTRLVTLFAIVLLGAAGVVPTAFAGDPAQAANAASVSQADLLARLEHKDPDLVVLDVRTPAEFAAGHVPGARNISHEQLVCAPRGAGAAARQAGGALLPQRPPHVVSRRRTACGRVHAPRAPARRLPRLGSGTAPDRALGNGDIPHFAVTFPAK